MYIYIVCERRRCSSGRFLLKNMEEPMELTSTYAYKYIDTPPYTLHIKVLKWIKKTTTTTTKITAKTTTDENRNANRSNIIHRLKKSHIVCGREKFIFNPFVCRLRSHILCYCTHIEYYIYYISNLLHCT